MERTMWNDARLDDLSKRMDAGFDRVDRDLHDLRIEVRDLRRLMFMLWGPTMLGIFGMIATVVVTNG
jgi:hypothetical protein